jgi:hypothetical protein
MRRSQLPARKTLAETAGSMRGIGISGAVIVAGMASGAALAAGDPAIHPFAFLAPALRLEALAPGALDDGQVFVKVLPGRGRELAVVAATRTTAAPERLIAWMRRVEAIQRSRYVPDVARFSTPPRLEDVAALTLDDEDVDEIRKCRPGNCGVKLSGGEISRLQQHLGQHADVKRDLEREFRQTIVDRARDYLADGDAGLPLHEDTEIPVAADARFAVLADHLGLTSPHLRGVAEYLMRYPRMDHPDVVESFLYWSRETLGFKPITNITHLTLMQSETPGMPGALAISKQVYANHYKDGAVAVTAITGSLARRYLVYAHRSDVDVLDGVWGGLARHMIERRVKDEAPAVLNALRIRVESGDPP